MRTADETLYRHFSTLCRHFAKSARVRVFVSNYPEESFGVICHDGSTSLIFAGANNVTRSEIGAAGPVTPQGQATGIGESDGGKEGQDNRAPEPERQDEITTTVVSTQASEVMRDLSEPLRSARNEAETNEQGIPSGLPAEQTSGTRELARMFNRWFGVSGANGKQTRFRIVRTDSLPVTLLQAIGGLMWH